MLILSSLFAVYINDLAQRINDLQCGFKIDDIFLSILLYADDIGLIAPDELKLQQMLDVVTSWCSEWKLHINRYLVIFLYQIVPIYRHLLTYKKPSKSFTKFLYFYFNN